MARSKTATDRSRAGARGAAGSRPAARAGEIAIISNMNIDFAEFHRKSRPQMIESYRLLLDLHLREGFAGSYGITGRTLEVLHDEAPDVIERMQDGIRRGILEFLSYTQYHVHPFFSTEAEFGRDVRAGIETFTRVLGRRPAGFHPPEFFHLSTVVLKELGIQYTVLYADAVDAPAGSPPPPVVKVRGHGRTTLPAVLVPRDSFRSAGHIFGSGRDVFWRQFESVPLVADRFAYLQYDAEIILMREFVNEEQYIYSSSPEEISLERAQEMLANFEGAVRELRERGYEFVRVGDVYRASRGRSLPVYRARTDLGTATPLTWSNTVEKRLALGFFHLANVLGQRLREEVEQDLRLVETQLLYLKGSDHLGFEPPIERIERTSTFARNLCNSLAYRLASFDTPESLYQDCALELDRFYQERLEQAAPAEFADFLRQLFGAAMAPVPRAGALAVPTDEPPADPARPNGEGGEA
jgi:peptidoglycan/xylan/chitin deacetylase (PgdA/CDA1 family)